MRRRWPSRSYSATTDVSLDFSEQCSQSRSQTRVALRLASDFGSDLGGARERSLDRDRVTTTGCAKSAATVPIDRKGL